MVDWRNQEVVISYYGHGSGFYYYPHRQSMGFYQNSLEYGSESEDEPIDLDKAKELRDFFVKCVEHMEAHEDERGTLAR